MAFIPVPNAIRLSFVFTIAGQEVVFTIGIGKADAWAASDIDNTLGDMKAWYDDNVKGIQNDSISLVAINGVDQSSETAPSRTLTSGLPITGTKTNAAMPNNAALCISLGTGLRGRSFRGRVFVPGLDDDDRTDEVSFTSALATAAAGAFSVINGYHTTPGAFHGVISRFHANAPRVTGLITPVTTYRVDTAIDSQRRRLAGRGN